MTNYSNGKVYKITGGGLTYVGSTCCPRLCSRLAGHRNGYKQWLDKNPNANYTSSYAVLAADPLATIELLESCPCDNRDVLRMRERFHIESIDCVNKVCPIRTADENVAYHAAYQQANKESLATYNAAYRQSNKESLATYNAAYRAANKESIAHMKAAYHQANKESIAAKKVAYRAANKESIAAYQAAYRAANKESADARSAVYYQANRESIAAKNVVYYQAKKDKLAAKRAVGQTEVLPCDTA